MSATNTARVPPIWIAKEPRMPASAKIIAPMRRASRPSQELRADGACASLDAGVFRVCDARGRVLFEYQPSVDRAVVHVPGDDVEFRFDGNVRWSAAGSLTLESRAGDAPCHVELA